MYFALACELGYTPKTVRLINGPVTTVHSKTCKIWHIPAKNVKSKGDESDSRHHRVCGKCLIASHYVSKALQKKCETKDSSLRINFCLEPRDQHFPGSLSLSLSVGQAGENPGNEVVLFLVSPLIEAELFLMLLFRLKVLLC